MRYIEGQAAIYKYLKITGVIKIKNNLGRNRRCVLFETSVERRIYGVRIKQLGEKFFIETGVRGRKAGRI